MAVSVAGRLDAPRRSRYSRRTRLPGAAPSRARSSAAVDTVVLGVCVGLALLACLLPTVVRDRTSAELRRTVAAPLAMLEQWSELHRAAFLSYDQRVAANGALVRAAQDAAALRAENARLRDLLALGARLQWGFVTAEAVPNQQAGELGSAQTLQEFKVTVGSRAGVALFTPVVAPGGLVGMVQQVDPVRSQVISYAHPDFRVSAQADSAYGIVQPHLGSGAERGLLELHGVAFRSPLKPGQAVISSGLGGTYPAGIPIGTVVRELQTPERWARTYLLQPAVSLADVGPVLLLLRARADRGLDSVWTSIHAVDVTSRRVAAAGDSTAREELVREAAARRAALDSVRGDSARRDSTAGASGENGVSRDSASPAHGALRSGESRANAAAPAPARTTDARPAEPPASDVRPPAATRPATRAAAEGNDDASATPRAGAARSAAATSSSGDTVRRRPPRPTVPLAGASPAAGGTATRANPRAVPRSGTRTRVTDSTAGGPRP
ncbi:hypothetical protein tb265_37330 [Gemmatimonadetes bacterium T265]|nr:hypothetical protein tb265_37330 [Gemmatimonadetes bacterium T265]